MLDTVHWNETPAGTQYARRQQSVLACAPFLYAWETVWKKLQYLFLPCATSCCMRQASVFLTCQSCMVRLKYGVIECDNVLDCMCMANSRVQDKSKRSEIA